MPPLQRLYSVYRVPKVQDWRARSKTGFVPWRLPGVKRYFDVNDSVLVSGNVSSLADRTSGVVLAQASAGVRPPLTAAATPSGHAAITLDGAHMLLNATGALAGTAFTWVFGIKVTGSGFAVFNNGDGANAGLAVGSDGTNRQSVTWGNAVETNGAKSANFEVWSLTKTAAAALKWRVNGVDSGFTGSTTYNNPTGLGMSIGGYTVAGAGTPSGIGLLTHAIGCDADLTASAAGLLLLPMLERYVASKIGI